ncbi:MAG: BREX system ATP-binding domain-containing protein [Longimicrobiales bacterium]
MSIRPSDYLEFVRDEYLDSFIREGGAAVKFTVPLDGATPHDLHAPLRTAATEAGYAFAFVDSAATRVHMIDQIFFDLARQVDWGARARVFAARALARLGFPDAGRGPLDLERIARERDYAAHELSRDYKRILQQEINQDFAMAKDFRMAMMRLCQAAVDPGPASQTTRGAVIEWLTGELRRVSSLREALIFQRITRANARHMLVSLAHWLRRTEGPGLVLALDIRQLAVSRRAEAEQGVYYTKAMVLDAYEVLRQLVDGTDELEGCLVMVICALEFLENARGRGLEAYQALQMRVYDEVRDRNRVNPLAALVRLSPAPVEVPA